MSDDDDKIFFAAINRGMSYREALYEIDKIRRNKEIMPNVNHTVKLWRVYVRYARGWQEGLLTDDWNRVMSFIHDNNWQDWHIEDVVPILSLDTEIRKVRNIKRPELLEEDDGNTEGIN